MPGKVSCNEQGREECHNTQVNTNACTQNDVLQELPTFPEFRSRYVADKMRAVASMS